jgi:isopropylmalate/homocitrate/citramalate synthase
MKMKVIDSKLHRSGSHQDAVNAFLDTLKSEPKEITTTVTSGHGDTHGGGPQIVTVIMHYGIKEK